MTTTKKSIISAIVALIVIVAGYFGINQNQTGDATGDTQSTSKISQIVMNGGSSATTTVNSAWASLYNGDSNARIIQDIYYSISGLETNFYGSLLAGTSTTAGTLIGVSSIFNSGILSTSTTMIYTSTSTSGAMSTAPGFRVWPAGTYLNVIASSTVTSGTTTTLTGTGIIGVKYAVSAQ